MKKIIFISFILFTSFLYSQQIDTLYILQTTDVHGNIYPYDYFLDQPADRGLAKIYTKVIEYRQHHKNVLLVDAGDAIQGTPLTYYFNKIETDIPHPLILTMNYMGYDAFAVGNHEIEQGVFTYLRAENESDFPWLSANSALEDGRTFFKPYTIIENNGIIIGIIGLTTPGIPTMLDESLYPGIEWKDMVKTAQKFASILRPQVDVLVGLFHAGFDEKENSIRSKPKGLPNANASGLVAKYVPEFDVIFGGHTHQIVPNDYQQGSKYKSKDKNLNKTLKINSGFWAQNLGVAQLILKQDEDNWQIISKDGWVESVQSIKPSKAILALTEYYHKKTLEYIRTEIAILSDTLRGKNFRFKDTSFIELINKAQLDYTDADISFAACFNDELLIKPGPIKIKDIYGMYQYENFLYVVEMTGKQIKDFLEYSARYYIWDGHNVYANPEIAGYSYDMAEGISYNINVTEEVGNRIKDPTFLKTGQLLEMNQVYKVAINSYRASGGGGHIIAAKAENAPITFKSNEEMRNILTDYIKKIGTIIPEVDENWKIIKGK
ncbi:MAG: 5'-nucleotidase C-terminal domain-containing protein [Candidatus Cloacimonetes bacterium]|nr:5'-nucleotidase C-terminal domain-containing protein [Candidatus Cloacimonadota bacterium]